MSNPRSFTVLPPHIPLSSFLYPYPHLFILIPLFPFASFSHPNIPSLILSFTFLHPFIHSPFCLICLLIPNHILLPPHFFILLPSCPSHVPSPSFLPTSLYPPSFILTLIYSSLFLSSLLPPSLIPTSHLSSFHSPFFIPSSIHPSASSVCSSLTTSFFPLISLSSFHHVQATFLHRPSSPHPSILLPLSLPSSIHPYSSLPFCLLLSSQHPISHPFIHLSSSLHPCSLILTHVLLPSFLLSPSQTHLHFNPFTPCQFIFPRYPLSIQSSFIKYLSLWQRLKTQEKDVAPDFDTENSNANRNLYVYTDKHVYVFRIHHRPTHG